MQPHTKSMLGRSSQKGQSSNRTSRNLYVVSAVFFGVFYLFLWLFVEPRLVCHYFEISQKSPFFKTGWLFLQDCLSYPGGLSRYLSAFLTQLCYFSWLGALCITLVAWAIYRFTVSLAAVSSNSPWRVICYIPALLMLMICGRYESPLSTAVAVLVVAFFSVLYEKLSPRLGTARVILFLIFSGVLYYVAGGAALIFIALAALLEYFNRGKAIISVLCLLLGLVVCWLMGVYVFELEKSEIYLYSGPFIPVRQNLQKEKLARVFEGALFVILPVAVLLVNLSGKLVAGKGVSRPAGQGRKDKSSDYFHQEEFKWVIQAVLLVLISVPSVLLSFDRKAKRVVQVSYYTCQRMWPEVLSITRKGNMKRYFPFCNHAVNRALFFTGRLGDEMFAYPQDYHKADLVFCPFKGGNIVFMERTELCLELGLVNVAEKIAHEFLEASDDSPFILSQFALINIVKGQIETARVFLRALSKNLIYGRDAKDLLWRLESDPQLEHDKRIQFLRSVMITEDDVYTDYNENDWLKELLHRNKYNKMAFEYLMAHYLLTRQLDKFVENLPHLDDFGYTSIPRHYQEAILVYIGTTRKDVDLGERGINVETVKQYDEVNKIGKKFSSNERVILKMLAPKFNHTYFFYFAFGASGVTR